MNNKKSLRFQLFFFYCVSIAILMGCTAVINYPTYSGFLGNYEGLYRSNFVEGAFMIDNPQKRVTDYAKFYVAPVVVYLTPNARAYKLSPPVLAKKVNEFQGVMQKALARDYAVADSPGAGVLVLKFAITDLMDVNSGVNARALLEADFVDGGTGERVVAFVYGYTPKTFDEWASILIGRLKEMEKETKVYTFDNKQK